MQVESIISLSSTFRIDSLSGGILAGDKVSKKVPPSEIRVKVANCNQCKCGSSSYIHQQQILSKINEHRFLLLKRFDLDSEMYDSESSAQYSVLCSDSHLTHHSQSESGSEIAE